MKLYHNATSWQLPGQQDKKAERVDVPAGAAEFCAWLNERRVPVAPAKLIPISQLAAEPVSWDGESVGSRAAVLTEAEVERVNQQRPSFIGRLSAEEIERHRMAANQCPKCGNSARYLQSMEECRIEEWLETAELDRIQRIIEHARTVVRERGELLDGEGRAN